MRDPVTKANGPRPADTMFVVGIVAIGAILRFLHLGAQSILGRRSAEHCLCAAAVAAVRAL